MSAIAFVNISHPGEIRNRRVQGAIRRHVMQDIGRSRRKRPRAKVIPLQVCVPSPAAGSQDALDEHRLEKDERAISPYFQDASASFGPSWSLSPSGILGVDLDDRMLQIVHFMKGEADYKYRPFHTIWIRMCLSDSTAFYLSLASALLFWDHRQGKAHAEFSDNPESAKYYFVALNQLMGRLSDPRQCVSAGVIATILGCLCHDTNVGNWKRWALHVDGLDRIAKLRGGLDGLENHIPLMAFWLDLVGRAVVDERPRFQIPQDLRGFPLQESPPTTHRRILELKSTCPQLSPIIKALQMMSTVAEWVNCRGDSAQFWENEVAAIHMLGPVTHHLLSGPRVPHTDTEVSGVFIVAESARLSCLMLLSALKKRFSLQASDMTPLQAKFAGLLVRDVGELDEPIAHLNLWAIATASLLLSSDTRMHLVPRMRAMIKKTHGLTGSRAAIASVKELIWIETLEVNEETQFAQEIDDNEDGCV